MLFFSFFLPEREFVSSGLFSVISTVFMGLLRNASGVCLSSVTSLSDWLQAVRPVCKDVLDGAVRLLAIGGCMLVFPGLLLIHRQIP